MTVPGNGGERRCGPRHGASRPSDPDRCAAALRKRRPVPRDQTRPTCAVGRRIPGLVRRGGHTRRPPACLRLLAIAVTLGPCDQAPRFFDVEKYHPHTPRHPTRPRCRKSRQKAAGTHHLHGPLPLDLHGRHQSIRRDRDRRAPTAGRAGSALPSPPCLPAQPLKKPALASGYNFCKPSRALRRGTGTQQGLSHARTAQLCFSRFASPAETASTKPVSTAAG